MEQIQLILIIVGIVIVIVGVLWQFIPFGRMPGDIAVEKDNFRFYFPIVTSIILSIVITVVLFLINYFKG